MTQGLGAVSALFVGILFCLPLIAYILTVRLLAEFCVDHGSQCSRWMLYFIGVFMTPVTLAVFALLCVLSERNAQG